MRAGGPPAGRKAWYEPDVLGNLELDQNSERVRVYLKYPTQGDIARLSSAIARMHVDAAAAAKGDPNAVVIKAGSVEQLKEETLKACVVKVANYDNANGDPIKTGAELYEHGDREIVDAVYLEVETGAALSKEEKKDSDQSQPLPPSDPPPLDGTAASVAD